MASGASLFQQTVRVELGHRSYDIVIGENVLSQAGQLIGSWCASSATAASRILLVADVSVMATYGDRTKASLEQSGFEVRIASVPSGEQSKCYAQLQQLHDVLVDMSADRKTIVVVVGGGVVGDLAGFAAASYARGLRFIQVPTTLLSMVDSSVGGKTGINHPRGKNLVGAFHQPNGVIIDLATLKTLPDREYRAGLAEVVKYGVILDLAFFEYLERYVDGLNNRTPDVLQHVVSRSCELKADVVRQDEFETTGLRAVLNYGHTFGHAFEALAGYGTLLHGEAVSIGMVCASRLAEKLRRISSADTLRQVKLLQALRLPVDVPAEIKSRREEIVAAMMLDKKTEARELRFVLPSCIGHVETVRGVSPEQALECL